ncbi:MAG TPA: sugar ABC transporter ATP-binding protein, partial [Roseiarcus sp.]|nr:sugar ABC transporter ATP-binding protein [Roseiarcus sp.]
MAELARLAAITKNFGGVRALRGVNFDVQTGEVHALVGENGAGKSTLMRVLGGEMAPTSGEIRIDGERVDFRGPREARAHGIAIIHQELALAPDLSVAENIFLGELSSIISWGALRGRASEVIASLGFDIDPSLRAGALAVAHQQVVEIAKALSRKVKIIVFDEPTAVLSAQDAERLHEIIARLRSEAVGVVYISHRLEEVLRIADRVTVMKDGQVVATRPVEGLAIDEMIRMMVGRPMSALFPDKGARRIGEERLVVRNLQAGRLVRDISFSVRTGEIVGLGGLVGSGRSEVARVIFGADRLDGGAILLNGKERKIRSPSEAVRAGVCLVPEDRKAQGVVLDAPIRVNATMAKL